MTQDILVRCEQFSVGFHSQMALITIIYGNLQFYNYLEILYLNIFRRVFHSEKREISPNRYISATQLLQYKSSGPWRSLNLSTDLPAWPWRSLYLPSDLPARSWSSLHCVQFHVSCQWRLHQSRASYPTPPGGQWRSANERCRH